MSDLFTKAANVKTTTKLWTIGVALLIMVNLPGTDSPSPSPSGAAPQTHSTSAAPMSAPTAAPASTPSASFTANRVPRNLQPASSTSITGAYTGTVHNQTASLSADFAIRLRDSQGNLSGSMSVKPPLYGSGPLMGTTDGKSLSFTVKSAMGTLTFTGVNEGEQLIGTYTVQHANGGRETGAFTLSKASKTHPDSPAETIPKAVAPVAPSVAIPETPPVVAEPPRAAIPLIVHSDPKNYAACMNGNAYGCNKALLTSDESMNVKSSDLRRNYSSCINGFSYGCNKSLLTPEETANVQASDLRRNYASCMNGFSYRCNTSLLTSDEASKVKDSDLRRNYAACMNGNSYGCRKALLNPDQTAAVAASDLRRNYSSCMNGNSYGCNKKLLTSDELAKVQASDLQRNYTACMNGNSYGCNRNLLTNDQLLEVEAKGRPHK